jgi:hypothetical protein
MEIYFDLDEIRVCGLLQFLIYIHFLYISNPGEKKQQQYDYHELEELSHFRLALKNKKMKPNRRFKD